MNVFIFVSGDLLVFDGLILFVLGSSKGNLFLGIVVIDLFF